MTNIPTTPFLRHGLLLNGKPYGESLRHPDDKTRYARTYSECPRAPVSVVEFLRDMQTIHPSKK